MYHLRGHHRWSSGGPGVAIVYDGLPFCSVFPCIRRNQHKPAFRRSSHLKHCGNLLKGALYLFVFSSFHFGLVRFGLVNVFFFFFFLLFFFFFVVPGRNVTIRLNYLWNLFPRAFFSFSFFVVWLTLSFVLSFHFVCFLLRPAQPARACLSTILSPDFFKGPLQGLILPSFSSSFLFLFCVFFFSSFCFFLCPR